jgi:hypothetical protein
MKRRMRALGQLGGERPRRQSRHGLHAGIASDASASRSVRRLSHSVLWFVLVALLVIVARWLCYALAPPSLLSTRLQTSTGGPRLVVVTLVSLGLAAALSTLTVALAAIGVRERQRLRPERVPPSMRVRRLAANAVLLFVASSLSFATFESYLHWRAGIGFHGLSCLVGPVHRNAIPLLVALALTAAAIVEAGSHVLAWMRAVVRELRRRRLIASPPLYAPAWRVLLAARPAFSRPRSRAPPLPA